MSAKLSPEDLAAAEHEYRRALTAELEGVLQRGLVARGLPVVLSLREIYLDLTLHAVDGGSVLPFRIDPVDAPATAGPSFAGTIAEALADGVATPRRLVVLGDPGSGKTTMLRLLAVRTAAPTLPIFMPLAACDELLAAAPETALPDLIALYWRRRGVEDLAPVIRQALADHRALILLDGLDEVLDRHRQAVLTRRIEAFLGELGPGDACVLTSRKVGYPEAPVLADGLEHLEIQPLSPAQVQAFADAWHLAFVGTLSGDAEAARTRAAAETAAFLRELDPEPELTRLAHNPLLLTMLIQLRQRLGKLPRHRVEIYQTYVRALLEQRDVTRNEGAHVGPRERFDLHVALDHLVDLGLELHLAYPQGVVPLPALERLCERIVLRYEGYDAIAELREETATQLRRRAADFLRDVSQVAGLIVEFGPGLYGFIHWSFQEFFAGRALARMPADRRWTLLRPHLHEPQWREVILFCASWLGVVEHRRDELSELCVQILNAGSRYESIVGRDLRLAVEILEMHPNLSVRAIDEFRRRFATTLANQRFALPIALAMHGAQILESRRAPAVRDVEPGFRKFLDGCRSITRVIVHVARQASMKAHGERAHILDVEKAPEELDGLREHLLSMTAQEWHQFGALAEWGGLTEFSQSVWDQLVAIIESDPSPLIASFASLVLLAMSQFLPPEGLPRRGVVRLDGRRVGLLEETPQGARFTYDAAWLEREDAEAISLTLPLRAEPYESAGLHPFFENLLPEGWLLELLSKQQKIAKNDRFGLLLAACGDTIGAVEIVPIGEDTT